MDLKDKAKLFAIKAHMGQVRKSEPDKPMIVHPLSVGMILEEYGYDDSLVAAGYLHDVIEDTKYTKEDLEKVFGKDITDLVVTASEMNKSLSWEERKTAAIKRAKNLPLRNKIVICADKINNLEDLAIKFQISGKRDFSLFKRGEDKQKWYYTSMYESLINNTDKELPIFKRLKDALDSVFYDKEDLYLRDTIFNDNKEYYEELKRLHAMKIELNRLKTICPLDKPFVIEFSGTPRTGKTTTINNLYNFFKKGGFNISVIEEFTTSKYYKEIFKKKYKGVSSDNYNIAIIEEVSKELQKEINSNKDIILIDRSINDRQIWSYRLYKQGKFSEEQYLNIRDEYKELSKKLIDFLVITYADPLISLKRDYYSSLALEKRTFLNMNNLNEFNNALKDLESLLTSSVEDYVILDTTSINMNTTSSLVAEKVMSSMKKKYIRTLKNNINM